MIRQAPAASIARNSLWDLSSFFKVQIGDVSVLKDQRKNRPTRAAGSGRRYPCGTCILSGLDRTDEPVFNVPKLGKSHLRSWQHHEPAMILPDGKRVYRFLPWESRLTPTTDYLFTDVSIAGYLERLQADGENIRKYQSIWYYL